MKKITLILLTLASFNLFAAGASIPVIITNIQVQENRTWINFEPSIGNATACTDKNAVEVNNAGSGAHPNRDLIMSVALTALASGKQVVWLTSDNCTNVNKDVVKGIRILK